MLNIGAVSYINALPLFLAFRSRALEARDYRFHYGVPARLNHGLRRGGLDISIISTYEYLENRERYTLLPKFGIACKKRAMSVNLYTRVPPEKLEGKRVGLTAESASSVNLFQVLCKEHWGVTPVCEQMGPSVSPESLDAFVLIGNQALERQLIHGYETVDLATAWNQMTKLPFVFAVLAARREIAENQPDELLDVCNTLEDALQWGESHSDQVLSEAMRRCPTVSTELLKDYYDCIYFRMGKKEKSAINQFDKFLSAQALVTAS